MNYFELYEIPVSFRPDQEQVKKQYYALSRKYHPDFFGGTDTAQQQEALEKSAAVNQAYKVFQSEEATIKYILQLHGLIEEEEKFQLPSDFLMEVMELNEQVMELDKTDTAAVASLLSAAKNLQNEIHEAIAPTLAHYSHDTATEKELLQIKDYYYKKKYLDRIISGLQ